MRPSKQSLSTPNHPAKSGSRFRWLIAAGACLLAIFATIVVAEELASGRLLVSPVSALINIVTALAALSGAFGYVFRRRWGVPLYGVSVLGHFAAHTLLILRAIAANRVTIFAIGGLSVIPVITLVVLIAMRWEIGQRNCS